MSNCCCEFPWSFTKPEIAEFVTTRLFEDTGSPPDEVWHADELGLSTGSSDTTQVVIAIAIHSSGDVIVASENGKIRRRSAADGSTVWEVDEDTIVHGLACDSSGNVYVALGTDPTINLVQLSGVDGSENWSVNLPNETFTDAGGNVTVSPSAITGICSDGTHCYVAAFYSGGGIDGPMVTKWDNTGTEVVTATGVHTGWPAYPSFNFNRPLDVDSDGTYIFYTAITTFGGIWLHRLQSDGTLDWSSTHVRNTSKGISAIGNGGCFIEGQHPASGLFHTVEVSSTGTSLGAITVAALSVKAVEAGKMLIGHLDGLRFYERAGASWAGESPTWTATPLVPHVIEMSGDNPVIGGGREEA